MSDISIKTFDVNYYQKDYKTGKQAFSHKYVETWTLTDYFCPSCASKSVWVADDGDFYVGCEFICASCESSFYMPNEVNKKPLDNQHIQRMAMLKNG